MEHLENKKDLIGMKDMITEIKISREIFGKWNWKHLLENGTRKGWGRKNLKALGDHPRSIRNYEREKRETQEIIKETTQGSYSDMKDINYWLLREKQNQGQS